MNARRPFTIGIGGAHSAVGKTSLAVAIIRHLTQHGAYPLGKKNRLGAVKYTRTELYSSLIEDEALLKQADKDTARLSSAGAEKVLWIKAPREELEELISLALSKLADLDGVVIEGNSAIEFAKPDIVIFILGEFREDTKLSAEKLIKQTDIIIAPKAVETTINKAAKLFTLKDYPYLFDDWAIQGIINLMEEIMKKKETERLLKERSVDGKISCTLARKIAEDLDVPFRDVGSTANELKIKIKSCELGCF